MPFLGYRDSPRRRHDLPPRVVLLLRPFFHYSAWRDAWILRLVGERFGPVIRETPARGPAPQAGEAWQRFMPLLRWARAIRAPGTVLLAGAIAVAAVLGFVLARSAHGGNPALAFGKPVSAGVLEVSFPDGWRLRPARQTSLLGPIHGRVASSGGGWIEVGTATTTDPSLLPASIVASRSGAPAAAQLVTLGGVTFYRYSGLRLRGLAGSESIYATPTRNGTVLAVCHSTSERGGFAGTCQHVVQSIRLRSGSLSPGLVPSYASTLTAVIGKLDTARAGWGAQLSAARTARGQAAAARQLSTAHAEAAAALAALDPGPATSANLALVGALRRAADAYNALGLAAADKRARAYHLAAATVADANATLSSALGALGAFGYRVS